MKITVQVKPKKKTAYIKQIEPDYYIVSVTEPPVSGRANDAVIKSLSRYFQISPSDIILLSGHTTKMKTFEVPGHQTINITKSPEQKGLF